MLYGPSVLAPGPKAPAVWQLLRYSHSPLPFLEECGRRYGDSFLLRWAGYGRFVMLADPQAVQDVFRGDGHALHSGEGNEFLVPTVGPNSVLVLDGEPHARQRRVLLPPLKGERMRSFFGAMQAATLEAVRAWPVGRPLRMLEPMQQITLRTILQAVLGLEAGQERDRIEGQVQRLLAQGRSRWSLILIKVLPVRLMQRTRWTPYFRQMHALNDSLYSLIRSRREAPRGEDVLADLLAATHENGRPLADEEIRDALVTLILAGHDTTAIALAWALEQIVPCPDVVGRITDELRATAGGALPGAEHLPRLEYLDAAVRESLRLRTILPFVVRLTKRPFVAAGREYPPGVVLCPCNHLVHRRADLYPEPEAFRPERFLERRYAGHEWFPFGGGNRTCLGMAFALYEMKAVLATLFSRVRLARPPGSRSAPVRRGVSLAPDDGAVMVAEGHLENVSSDSTGG
ncbi:MAG TPA: cytochrome P450 [Gemmataceae bacterium]|nr:cytochrome P450 [Gemmataceae bacterium]